MVMFLFLQIGYIDVVWVICMVLVVGNGYQMFKYYFDL